MVPTLLLPHPDLLWLLWGQHCPWDSLCSLMKILRGGPKSLDIYSVPPQQLWKNWPKPKGHLFHPTLRLCLQHTSSIRGGAGVGDVMGPGLGRTHPSHAHSISQLLSTTQAKAVQTFSTASHRTTPQTHTVQQGREGEGELSCPVGHQHRCTANLRFLHQPHRRPGPLGYRMAQCVVVCVTLTPVGSLYDIHTGRNCQTMHF